MMLKHRQISPVELTQAFLARIGSLNPALNAYITLLPEQALETAAQAEAEIMAGHYRGPLHGIPIAHKDVYLTRGIRTTAHSQVLAGYLPDRDATVVERLASSGAILLGKLNTYEFACGATDSFGVPVNPWDFERTTGGSSAGSGAAVSASLCLAATGTDTGGSIRSPASYCGVVGLKPTYGRVSRAGILPVSWSLDHAGFLTRTVRDAAIVLEATAGFDPRDPSSSRAPSPDYFGALGTASLEGPPKLYGIRLGIPHALFLEPVTPEVKSLAYAAVEAFEKLGAVIQAVELPSAALSAVALQGIMSVEATSYHLGWLRRHSQVYAPFTRQKLLLGACIGGAEYLRAQQIRHAIYLDLQSVFKDVDALVWPTTHRPAMRLDEPEVPTGVQTRLTNLTGNPSISVPCGFTRDGLPVGLQINGRLFDEAVVLRLADAYEQVSPWRDHQPDLHNLRQPPASKPYTTPTCPSEVTARELDSLSDEVRHGLQKLALPLLEEDLEPLAVSLHTFRSHLQDVDEALFVHLEPPIHQHIGNLPSTQPFSELFNPETV